MGQADHFKPHDYNVICDRCGFKFKASQCSFDHGRRGLKKSLFVCSSCLDKPQGQDYVKGVSDKQTVPIVRSEGVDKFIQEPVDPYEF